MKRSTYIVLIVLFFLALAAVGTFFVIVEDLRGRPVQVPARGYLDVPLAGELPEVAPPESLLTVLAGRRPVAMHDLWENLRKAKVDGRVQAVILRLGRLECGWAKANEVREAILDFRRSSKKVYALIDEAPDFDLEYFVATGCDRIILQPLGWLGIDGIGGYVPFLRGFFDKVGIQAQFEHIAQYKTAANMFTEKGFTPADREETESIYGDLFDQYVRVAAQARGKTDGEFRALIDKASFLGDQAREAGLVDDCLYEDEVQALLQRDGGMIAPVPFDEYTRIPPSSVGLETGPHTVALIYAVGMIVTGEGVPQMMGASTVAAWIRSARTDPLVKAIVLRIDSPGGSSVGSDIIWREVALAKKAKPVIVSMSDVAGSGGYWIALPATGIVAQPQTLTGSIGVLAGKFSIDGLMAKLGVTADKVAFGAHADEYSLFRPFTEDELKALNDDLLWTYGQFLARAAEGRGLTRDEVDAVGRGRVWTGRQAKDRKLVDELGGLTMAIGLAKKESGIDADEEVRLDVWPRKRTFWQALWSGAGFGLDTKSAGLRERLVDAARFVRRTRVWAVMPFWLQPQ
jgi:protease-4